MDRRRALAVFGAVPLVGMLGREPVRKLDDCQGAADALGDAYCKLPPARLHRLATYAYADADRLTEVAPTARRRKASETAARLALYAGAFAANLGESEESYGYHAHARRHARDARDRELEAWSYALAARLPLYDVNWRRESRAPTLVALASGALGKRKAPVGEELCLSEALVCARLADERGALDALTTAAMHSGARGVELRPFPPAALALGSGEVFAQLGMTDETTMATREARRLLPPALAADRTRSYLDDALVTAGGGNMLDAADMGRQAMAELSEDRRTAGTVYRARTLARLTGSPL